MDGCIVSTPGATAGIVAHRVHRDDGDLVVRAGRDHGGGQGVVDAVEAHHLIGR